MRVVELKPLTRVEGHGSVKVFLDGRRVEKVELHLNESPRLFEALLRGKNFAELPEIICRVCSICSTIHRVTSLAAIEQAFAIQVSEQTRLYRELILHGGNLASHALHLFLLVLPDQYQANGFAELAARAPDEFRLGLRLKAAGNLIQETVGGRQIHPVTLIPGGMGKPVGTRGLLALKKTLGPLVPDAQRARELFASFSPDASKLARPCHLAVQGGDTPSTGTHLTLSDGRSTAVGDYRKLLGEECVSHSNAKQSRASGTIVTVGALARLNLGAPLAPLAAGALADCRDKILGADIRANNLAQAVEMLHALEQSILLIDQLVEAEFRPEKPPGITSRPGTGTAAFEAPRGTLIHSYSFDSRGACTAADIITPTAINQLAMERDLLIAARALETAEEAEMIHQLEMLVRAYDPCISCAVHLVRR